MNDIRLIDANSLMKNIGKIPQLRGITYGRMKKAVEETPTIDAVPVVHGRWEWYEDWGPSTWLEPPDLNKAGWKCSNCGIDLGDYLTDCLGVNVYVDEKDKMPKIKRCPHCGAKMDGGAEDANGR